MAIIQFKDVWEMYRIKFVMDNKTSWENFWALKGINFAIERGETLGVIGENGAGKSTLLKLIAGILKPDRGEVIVSGRACGLLELGVGFQPELTGRENIYLNTGLFGLSREQVEERYQKIADFASLGKFIHAPVKCYSQGMFVRLAFATAIHSAPDILLIDDILAVGDEYFQRKCLKKVFELKEEGKVIVFVSHDMNILKRLCKRLLFLKEGRIMKDDAPQKVIPFYSQLIGPTGGTVILEKNPLKLVFNNGRLFLNWEDKLLTSNSGAHTIFLKEEKWYSSLQAEWEVRKETENKLVATGRFYPLALTQIWNLEITNDYEIKWNIEIESQAPFGIREGRTNIMLSNEYTRWFTPFEKGEFPPLDDKNRDWQVLSGDNLVARAMGVEAKEAPEGKIPSLLFQQSPSYLSSSGHILNADYLTNSGALQYKTSGLENYSGIQSNRFIYFAGKIIIGLPDIDNYLKNLEGESVLSNGKLKLIFDRGQYLLCYKGKTLTKARHINTVIYAKGKWYASSAAQWQVKKEKKNKIIARGIWPDLPIVETWDIEMIDDFSYLWKINLRVDKGINIEEQHVRFMCCADYRYWFSEYETGEFLNNFLEREIDIAQRCIPGGIIGLESQNDQFPGIHLEFSKELRNFAKVFNSDFYNKARILRIDKVESEADVIFLPGEYPCFVIKVSLSEDKKGYRKSAENMLQHDKLKFVFDKGSGRIYWDGVELTKKLGLYTSLRSAGRWHNSASSALWRIEEKSKDSIKAQGRWLDLPVIQHWEIKLKESGLIDFNVVIRIDKEIEVDRLQANLILSERYLEWITDQKKGPFPLFREDVDDDWDSVWLGKDNSKDVGVLKNIRDGNDLPSVIFSPCLLNTNWYLNILNSDIYHRGRVLQYLSTDKVKIPPGEYPYFKGTIHIGA